MTTGLPVSVPIDMLAQFDRVTDYWSPKVVARVNDQYVKVARLLGEMDWHSHADEDELFWVLRGRLRLEFRDRAAELSAGPVLRGAARCRAPSGRRGGVLDRADRDGHHPAHRRPGHGPDPLHRRAARLGSPGVTAPGRGTPCSLRCHPTPCRPGSRWEPRGAGLARGRRHRRVDQVTLELSAGRAGSATCWSSLDATRPPHRRLRPRAVLVARRWAVRPGPDPPGEHRRAARGGRHRSPAPAGW